MSVIAAALKHMLASKMNPDEIVAAVEAMEAEIAAPQRTARQEQNARAYAKRKALKPAEMTLNQHAETPTEPAEFSTPEATPARAPTCGNSTNLSTTSNRLTDGAEGKAREEISIADAISPILPEPDETGCDAAPETDLLGETPKIERKRKAIDESWMVDVGLDWNELAAQIGRKQVNLIHAQREAGLRRIWREMRDEYATPQDCFQAAFTKIRASPFLRGETERWAGVTLDWVLNLRNFTKIMEGNYEPETRRAGQNGHRYNASRH